MNFKAKLRIPTKEQYSYIEVDAEGTAEEIKQQYDELTALMNKEPEKDADFYAYLINLMNSDLSEWGGPDYYASLSQSQKDVMQSIKRLYKRLNANVDK